jgi:alkylation response protein AidB-like acyl-CoA dehydrogenase
VLKARPRDPEEFHCSSCLEPNDIVCSGVEEKMGLHGSPTCSMALGGKGKCRGLLLGEENKGLMVMFHMMNEARLDVGAQGFLHASAAYLYAVNYARERLQGRDIEAGKDPTAPQVPIICHPDVRRMLLLMKAYVDGMRSFIYYVAYCFDKKSTAKTRQEKERYHDFIELLTPIIKAYCSERGAIPKNIRSNSFTAIARSPVSMKGPMEFRPWIYWGASWELKKAPFFWIF